jgi:hypothetical protein
MASVIVLLNQELEITDLYTMDIIGRQTVIVFSDEQKLDEVQTTVSLWAAQDGLTAAVMNLEAQRVEEVEQLLRAMSPGLGQLRFVSDTDPVVDRLLEHIRGG